MIDQRQSQREKARLAALCRFDLLDTPSEERFADLTRLAAQICGTPIALITLLNHRRQWLKSKVGTDIGQMPRELSFCEFTLDSPELLLVPDARIDPRFAACPLVTGEPFIRFYAGAPLLTPDGDILGTLCVVDTEPRTLSLEQQSSLRALSRQVMAQMELQRALAELIRAETAHERDTEALRRSEEQYRLLFAVNPNPMWVFDRATLRILAVNAAAVSSYGYSQDEFLRLTIRELRPEEHIAEPEAALESLPPETNHTGIYQHRRKDKTLLWADVTSHPLTFNGYDCRMVTALNVTERQEAEEALQQKNALLQAVTESISDALFVKDLAGRYLLINTAGARAIGRPIPEILGREDAELFPPQTAQQTRINDLRILASGQTESYEDLEADGRTFLSSKGVYRDAQGEIAGVFGICHDITSQRQVDQARHEAEEKYRSIFENAVEGIFQSVPGGGFRGANPALATMLGYDSPEELLAAINDVGTQVYAHPQERSEMQRLFEREGMVTGHELQVQRKDGTTFWASLSARAVRDPRTGRIQYIEGSAVDVTARRQAEERLRQLADVVEYSSEAIISKTPDDVILSWNPGAERLYGYRAEEAIGQRFGEIVPPAAPGGAPLLTRLLAGENISHIETARLDRWGRRVDITVSISPIRDSQGQVRAISSIATDITARKQTEQALRESESLFLSAFDDAPIGMTLCDLEGQYVQVNPAFCRLIGYSQSELLQCRFQTISHPDDVEEDTDAYREVKAGNINGYTLEKRYFHKSGHIVWVQISVSLVRDGQGKPLYSIAQIQDITHRRSLEEEQERLLLQTEALLSEALERADRDPLTGLFNHRVFHKRLDDACERAQANDTLVSIVMVDLDNFKFFNDAYGHLAGDEVLRRIASVLSACVRPGDTLARFGGDEFALLLPGLDEDAACALIRQARARLEDAGYRPEGSAVAIPLTLSAGIAAWPQDGMTRLEAVERADERLRLNKSGADDMQADHIRTHMGRALEGFTMLDALVTAVDNKDRYTRRHSDDVLTYSMEIAQGLELDVKTQETVAVAALLHDVGKISVPDRILRKPGKLTEEEFAAIQQHPMMGAIIVGAVPGLEKTLDAVRHHHERWDGGGYPFGLRGIETPLIARLMAVADAFSAMTTDRPYRKGMPHEKALGILAEGAGTQWDPVCVETFLRARGAA